MLLKASTLLKNLGAGSTTLLSKNGLHTQRTRSSQGPTSGVMSRVGFAQDHKEGC